MRSLLLKGTTVAREEGKRRASGRKRAEGGDTERERERELRRLVKKNEISTYHVIPNESLINKNEMRNSLSHKT